MLNLPRGKANDAYLNYVGIDLPQIPEKYSWEPPRLKLGFQYIDDYQNIYDFDIVDDFFT